MGGRDTKIIFAPPKNSQKILSYIIKYKKQFIITALTGVFFNSAIVLGPIFQGKLLDAALTSQDIWGIVWVGLQFIFITLCFQIARFFKRYYVRDMANRISGDMRIGIIQALLSTDLNTIEKQKVGDMMTRTIGDVDIVVEAVRKTITELWDTWVLMLAYFVTLMIYDVKITLIAAAPIPLAILAAQLLKGAVHSYSQAARKANSKTTTQIRKMISEINLLRLYGREESELKRLEEKLRTQADITAKASVLKGGLGSVYSSISTIGILLVIALGSRMVMDKSWTIGTFTAYITMFSALAARTTTAAKVFNIQHGARASWERVKVLIGNSQLQGQNKEEGLDPHTIRVERLSFKYPTGGKYAIKDLSFNVAKGMIVGVTGSVGSGKSALGLALTGLYDYEGNIYIDDKEFRDIPYSKKISTISYMGHNSLLFSETLENNITWGDTKEKDLDKVLNIASLEDDIEKFEDSIKTQVGERGTKVSGGQKQRISLARALYKNAKIIILDDPFSAVDIGTESKIIDELHKNVGDKILFIFSHRLDAFKYTDKVLVLDKGEIVQEGPHDELIRIEGIYSKIVDSQKFIW